MSLVSQISALSTRVATECKSLWTAVAGKEPSFSKNSAFNKNFGTSAGNVCQGNDSRLSDQRTPTDSSVTTAKLDARYKSIIAMSALDINCASGQVFTKTLTADSTLTFSNLHIGVKDIEITGDFVLSLPTWLKVIDGTYDGTVLNLIQVVITNDQTGSESGWCMISQEAV